MANTDRDSVVAWLARASEKELADAIYEAVRTRPRTPDSEDEPGHLVLATASLDRGDGSWSWSHAMTRPTITAAGTATCHSANPGSAGTAEMN